MVAWQMWLIIAGVCLIIEIATVGFLVFWFAVAAAITCLISLFVDNIIIQTAIFIILSCVLILFTRKFANKMNKQDHAITNSNSIIGKEAIVKKEITPLDCGQVKINGDIWTAILDQNYISIDKIPSGSTVEVLKIDGVKLVVKPLKINSKEKVDIK